MSRVFCFEGKVMELVGHCPLQPVQNTTQLLGFETLGFCFPWSSIMLYTPSLQYFTQIPQLLHVL